MENKTVKDNATDFLNTIHGVHTDLKLRRREIVSLMESWAEYHASLQCAELKKEVERLKQELEFEIGVANSQTQINVELSQENDSLQAECADLKKHCDGYKLLTHTLQAENESLKKLISVIHKISSYNEDHDAMLYAIRAINKITNPTS